MLVSKIAWLAAIERPEFFDGMVNCIVALRTVPIVDDEKYVSGRTLRVRVIVVVVSARTLGNFRFRCTL